MSTALLRRLRAPFVHTRSQSMENFNFYALVQCTETPESSLKLDFSMPPPSLMMMLYMHGKDTAWTPYEIKQKLRHSAQQVHPDKHLYYPSIKEYGRLWWDGIQNLLNNVDTWSNDRDWSDAISYITNSVMSKNGLAQLAQETKRFQTLVDQFKQNAAPVSTLPVILQTLTQKLFPVISTLPVTLPIRIQEFKTVPVISPDQKSNINVIPSDRKDTFKTSQANGTKRRREKTKKQQCSRSKRLVIRKKILGGKKHVLTAFKSFLQKTKRKGRPLAEITQKNYYHVIEKYLTCEERGVEELTAFAFKKQEHASERNHKSHNRYSAALTIFGNFWKLNKGKFYS